MSKYTANTVFDKRSFEEFFTFLNTSLKDLDTSINKLSKSEGFKALNTTLKDSVKIQKELVIIEKEREKLAQEKQKTDKLIIQTQKEKIKLAEQKKRQDEKEIQSKKKLTEEQKKVNKEAERRLRALKSLSSAQIKQNELLKEKKRRNREEIRDQLGITDAYGKLSKKLTETRRKLKSLVLTEGEGSKKTKQLRREVVLLDARLKKVDAGVGQFQRNVGNYGKALGGLKNIISGLGITAGAGLAISVLKNGLNIIKAYTKELSTLQALTSATDDDMKILSKQALELGASTQFSATQILKLDQELAKLGFTFSEIKAAVPGVQALAAATGFDLAESAALAGASLRIFGLDASEAGRVADVLAVSTTKSALDMSKLSTALPIVGTTAKIAGLSIEQTVAQLGVLADRGIDASTAASGLRNVFLELSKKGLTWEKAAQKINAATDKNAVAMAIFGKRSATTAIVLAENEDSVTDLTEKLEKLDITAQDMADTMLDNLAGDITLAKSAWEGFILSLDEGEGVLSQVSRTATQLWTGLLSGLTQLNKIQGEVFEAFASDDSFALIRMKNRLGFQMQLQKDIEETTKALQFRLNTEDDISNSIIKQILLRGDLLRRELELVQFDIDNKRLTEDQLTALQFEAQLLQGKIINLEEISKRLTAQKEAQDVLDKGAADALKLAAEKAKKQREKDRKAQEKIDKERAKAFFKQEKADAEAAKRRFEAKLKAFADAQALEKANFEFEKEVALDIGAAKRDILIKEKEFKKKQTEDLLAFIISSGQNITEAEKVNLQKLIFVLQNEIDNLLKGPKVDFFARLLGKPEGEQTGIDRFLQDLGLDNEGIEKVAEATINLLSKFDEFLTASFERRKQNVDDQIGESQRLQEESQTALDKEIDHLNRLEEAGVAFDTTEKKRLEKKIAEERKREEVLLADKKKIARQEKAIQITKSIINTAAGVVQGLNNPFPLNFIIAALVAAAGAVEIAIIGKQKFAKGATWIEKGKSHAEGGNVYGNVEVERGERMSVFSKKATSTYGKSLADLTNAANDTKLPDWIWQNAGHDSFDLNNVNLLQEADKEHHKKLDKSNQLLEEINVSLNKKTDEQGRVVQDGSVEYIND